MKTTEDIRIILDGVTRIHSVDTFIIRLKNEL